MDEMLPDEIPAIRDMIQKFFEAEVLPVMDDFEKRQELPRALVKKAGALGLYGAVFPESVGGTDLGYLAAAIIQEEMVRLDVRFAAANNQQGSTCPTCIYAGGSPEQVMKYVPKLLSGENIGMMSLSEPAGGSDAFGAMKTVARRDSDVYKINGAKMWASLSNETDTGVLFCKTDPAAGSRGVSAFIVEPKKYPKGWEAKPIDLLGLSKCFRTCAVFLDDFEVPVQNLIGNEGDGAKIVMNALRPGRVTVGAKALGLARGCYDDAVRYANERELRGGPIGKFQMVQADIAEMATEIEATRALVYEVAQRADMGLPTNRQAAIAKFHASKTAKFCADKAQQILGGYGLTEEFRISRYKAYADLFFTGEGTANVQRELIALDALGYKDADRHHGRTGLRDPRRDDVAEELAKAS